MINYKKAFLEKHNNEYKIETSPMDENGQYIKTYVCDDGAVLYEVTRPVWEKAETEVKGIKVKVDVQLLETEIWNTDNAKSRKWYELY